MNIGIDCDGVLTDMSEYILRYGEKLFGRKPSNPDALDITDIFNCTKLQETFFGLRYFLSYCKKWPPRKHASSAVKKLQTDGHKVFQITARKFTSGSGPVSAVSRYIYKRWLKDHNFDFDGIFYCSESRVPADKLKGVCRFSADVMIDDRPDVALYLAEKGVKVLLFDARYNRKVSHRNITRVCDWKEIYRKISEIAVMA